MIRTRCLFDNDTLQLFGRLLDIINRAMYTSKYVVYTLHAVKQLDENDSQTRDGSLDAKSIA